MTTIFAAISSGYKLSRTVVTAILEINYDASLVSFGNAEDFSLTVVEQFANDSIASWRIKIGLLFPIKPVAVTATLEMTKTACDQQAAVCSSGRCEGDLKGEAKY